MRILTSAFQGAFSLRASSGLTQRAFQ